MKDLTIAVLKLNLFIHPVIFCRQIKIWKILGSFPTPVVCSPICTVAVCGLCGSMQVFPPRKKATKDTIICCRKG